MTEQQKSNRRKRHAAYMREYRKDPLRREEKRAEDRKRYAENADVRERAKSAAKRRRKKDPKARSEYEKRYARENREKIRVRHARWMAEKMKDPTYREKHNRDTARRSRKASRRVKIRAYVNNRRKTDKAFRLSGVLRGRVHKAIKRGDRSLSTMELIGCDIEHVIAHLESRFLAGMTWENYGYRGWHIDHIRPCASFNLADPEQQRACFHYSNLQPLWRYENQSKQAKWPDQ